MVDQTKRVENKNKWTVLVFMGADNLPEEPDLQEAAERDLREMQKVIDRYPASSTLAIVCQVFDKGGVRRGRILTGGKGRLPDATAEVRNTETGSALVDFIKWGVKEAGHQPGDHLMLILWGHAYRFAIGAHLAGDVVYALAFAEVTAVLQRSGITGQVDVLAFDACDCSTIEMAVQLQPVAHYLLASQTTMPIPGFPYDAILDRLADPWGRLMGPAEAGAWMVRRFCERYSVDDREREAVSLTLLDLQQVPAVAARTERLARALVHAVSNGEDEFLVQELFQRSQVVSKTPKPFVDAADLCLNLLLNCQSADVAGAAQALGDLLLSPAPVKSGHSASGLGRPFIVEHGGNSCITARLNGVSLFAPRVTGPGVDAVSLKRYDALAFAQGTWRDLVVTMANL